MNFSGFSSGFNTFFEWLMRLALLNALWILFTILGLGVFGWAPATVAMFAVLRRRLLHEEDSSLMNRFIYHYKKDFWKANMIGLLLLLGVMTLFVSTQMLAFMTGFELTFFGVVVSIFAVLLFVMALFIFPVYVHYDIPLKKCLHYSLMIGIAHVHYCLFLLFGMAIITVLIYAFPGLLIFYGASLVISLVCVVSLNAFAKMEERQGQQQEQVNY
ncbi:YesL family protein [Halalkalibacter sp. AB-rgal2]|uniref:YesL family protein n=1 Tax=Halalkalibacter sp. AB-rgal2 TaxID=3242695 RepID=UPI00359DEFF6